MVGLGLGTFFHFLVASCHVSFEHIQSLDSVLVPLGVAGRQVASLFLAFVVFFVLRKQLIDESERKGRSRATIGTESGSRSIGGRRIQTVVVHWHGRFVVVHGWLPVIFWHHGLILFQRRTTFSITIAFLSITSHFDSFLFFCPCRLVNTLFGKLLPLSPSRISSHTKWHSPSGNTTRTAIPQFNQIGMQGTIISQRRTRKELFVGQNFRQVANARRRFIHSLDPIGRMRHMPTKIGAIVAKHVLDVRTREFRLVIVNDNFAAFAHALGTHCLSLCFGSFCFFFMRNGETTNTRVTTMMTTFGLRTLIGKLQRRIIVRWWRRRTIVVVKWNMTEIVFGNGKFIVRHDRTSPRGRNSSLALVEGRIVKQRRLVGLILVVSTTTPANEFDIGNFGIIKDVTVIIDIGIKFRPLFFLTRGIQREIRRRLRRSHHGATSSFCWSKMLRILRIIFRQGPFFRGCSSLL
mmetsp:Transcript_14574/g.26405  ORF Transcript_14574/g.26405 Transcript_14574/m.26405 type:complete len:463 (-) Transcript_14574:584-1972(-)